MLLRFLLQGWAVKELDGLSEQARAEFSRRAWEQHPRRWAWAFLVVPLGLLATIPVFVVTTVTLSLASLMTFLMLRIDESLAGWIYVMPLGTGIVVAAVLPALGLRAVGRSMLRQAVLWRLGLGSCIACGYSLRGLATSAGVVRCPECGADVPAPIVKPS